MHARGVAEPLGVEGMSAPSAVSAFFGPQEGKSDINLTKIEAQQSNETGAAEITQEMWLAIGISSAFFVVAAIIGVALGLWLRRKVARCEDTDALDGRRPNRRPETPRAVAVSALESGEVPGPPGQQALAVMSEESQPGKGSRPPPQPHLPGAQPAEGSQRPAAARAHPKPDASQPMPVTAAGASSRPKAVDQALKPPAAVSFAPKLRSIGKATSEPCDETATLDGSDVPRSRRRKKKRIRKDGDEAASFYEEKSSGRDRPRVRSDRSEKKEVKTARTFSK